jgi:hypothetical protein
VSLLLRKILNLVPDIDSTPSSNCFFAGKLETLA